MSNQAISRLLQQWPLAEVRNPPPQDGRSEARHDAPAPTRIPLVEPKLSIGEASGPLEREADQVADSVATGASRGRIAVAAKAAAPGQLSRKCTSCEAEDEAELLQAKSAGTTAPGEVPHTVYEVLASPGRALDASARSLFEARFGADFSQVRIHTGSKAQQSAAAVNALAYTVGRDIAFGQGRYQPGSLEGQRLIAHELTHVLQQRGASPVPPDGRLSVGPSGTEEERQARRTGYQGGARAVGETGRANRRPTVMRADPDAVSQVMKMRTVAGAGIQFFPTNVTDTRIGPVSVQGGLSSHGASRLNVIVGVGLSPRTLARQILPLWTTATPFTPSGGGAAIAPGSLSEEQLAQGLLVYNRFYLPVPAMTEWRAGLHLPLPAEIEEATGIATVNPEVIRLLAASFDPAWAHILDLRAAAAAAPPAATVQADVTAFLAQEPTTLGRGVGLAARALTNAEASLPFIREAFAQLGVSGFEVALTMMDQLVNRDLGLLASQRDGAAIVAVIRTALASAPAVVPAGQQASLDRANAMLARVAAVAASGPSAAVPARAEKAVAVDAVRLDGSTFDPATQVAVANTIFAQCNVRFDLGINATATAAQTTGWLGANRRLAVAPSCGSATAEERALYEGASTAFGLNARLRAFFVPDFTGYNASGYSLPPYCATGGAAPFRNVAVIANTADTSTLAHEIGHILLNSGGHPTGTLMEPRPRPNEITDPQCATIYGNA